LILTLAIYGWVWVERWIDRSIASKARLPQSLRQARKS
jgi:hypothetical protein